MNREQPIRKKEIDQKEVLAERGNDLAIVKKEERELQYTKQVICRLLLEIAQPEEERKSVRERKEVKSKRRRCRKN